MIVVVVAMVLAVSLMTQGTHSQPTVAACADGVAKYNVTFVARWSKAEFPKQYPLYRPHAQWTKVIGRTHSSVYGLFEVGQTASPALKDFVQTGYSTEYDDEAQGRAGVLDIFAVPSINRGVGTTSARFYVDAVHPKVSMVARIVPSPDWFVGVSSLNLCEEGVWVDHLTFDLSPMDAGTDKGMTFSAPNWAEDPQLPITVTTSQEPHHPANSFFYPEKTALPPLATLEFRKISSYTWQEGVEEVEEEEPTSGDADEVADAVAGPIDCEVTEWEEWGACSKTCGFGTRMRTRQIVRYSAHSGTPCPTLEEPEFCGSMRSCGWKHFQFGGGSKRAGRRTFSASPSAFGDGRYRGRYGNSRTDTQGPVGMREPSTSEEDVADGQEARRYHRRRSVNNWHQRNY